MSPMDRRQFVQRTMALGVAVTGLYSMPYVGAVRPG